jgi:transcriptional regulator with XRE-family HTH domain
VEIMSKNYLNFGDFIAQKREEKKITLREMARKLDLTPHYLSDVEKDRRNPFDLDKLELLTSILLFLRVSYA